VPVTPSAAVADADDLRPRSPAPRGLSALLAEVPGLSADHPVDGMSVTGCTHDSRRIRPGDLYVALPGAHVHGIAFAEQALAAGAVAVFTDREGAAASSLLPAVVAERPRELLGRVASWVHDHPAQTLTLLGVTGTNGKTTTAFLLEAGLRGSGARTGLIGTVETRIGSTVLPKHWITNPEATDLYALLALMREQQVQTVAMEVSSHALAVGRVDGVRFAAAAFTNFSQDHLELHPTMADYFAAKASLFTPERAAAGIVNLDDQACRRLLGTATIPMSGFSTSGDPGAQWRAEDVDLRADGSTFRFIGPDCEVETSLQLPGAFNVSNAVAALACLVTAGTDVREAAAGIAALPGVPGRMERVDVGQPFSALVDYAHTPAAVENLLAATRRVTQGRVIVVLGCGGDRDATKRPLMGQAAVRGADVAVFTSDNPRGEDPLAIVAQMGAGGVVEPDRRAAIALAVRTAGPGDTVVVAGKGHETGQEIAGVVTPFDDRSVLREEILAVTG
jgi:UDP-N-acetylmuramoyl-L-alanyl-D-glutamate--2,6-diaminopimelate ligase